MTGFRPSLGNMFSDTPLGNMFRTPTPRNHVLKGEIEISPKGPKTRFRWPLSTSKVVPTCYFCPETAPRLLRALPAALSAQFRGQIDPQDPCGALATARGKRERLRGPPRPPSCHCIDIPVGTKGSTSTFTIVAWCSLGRLHCAKHYT